MITQPSKWEPWFRLNTCVLEICQHYLHDGPCRVPGCTCHDGVGRWHTYNATQSRTKTCWHGVRPSSNCSICQAVALKKRKERLKQRKVQ